MKNTKNLAVTVLLRCCYGLVFFQKFYKILCLLLRCCYGLLKNLCFLINVDLGLYNLDLHLGAGTHT